MDYNQFITKCYYQDRLLILLIKNNSDKWKSDKRLIRTFIRGQVQLNDSVNMKFLIIFVLFGLTSGAKPYRNDSPNKVMIDWLLNMQLANLDMSLKGSKMTTIDLGDHTLACGLVAKGVKLADISSLTTTDHAYLWTDPGNTIEADCFIGLKNMTVTVDQLTYDGQSFPATLVVGVNSLGFHQSLALQETSCEETYSKIAFNKLNDVKIFSPVAEYNNQDVTEFVQFSVIPYVNGLMQQKQFLNIIQSFMNICSIKSPSSN